MVTLSEEKHRAWYKARTGKRIHSFGLLSSKVVMPDQIPMLTGINRKIYGSKWRVRMIKELFVYLRR